MNTLEPNSLRSFIERIERTEAIKAEIIEDIKMIYLEAKGAGFDTKIMRKIVKIRKLDAMDRREQEALLDVYLARLGMVPDYDVGHEADD